MLLELGQFLRFTEGAEAALEQLRFTVDTAALVDDDDLRCPHARRLRARSLQQRPRYRSRGHGARASARGCARIQLHEDVRHAVLRPPVRLVRSGGARTLGFRTVAARGRATGIIRIKVTRPGICALLEWRAGNWEAAAAAAASAITFSEQYRPRGGGD